ncbi:MAG: hypothetical protein UV59_C0008G0027 [Candidatus Gottesmanbacteria bacterium GW2011_GWA1_43_11]|uniref:Uncharacterized protein n=1 Tax=Candidatus Gottesmanbacteria bacterium GW2011_GWA1_43_11 TaxID=1618436 RepID=A0A0G1CIM0_9BACT|nr:MAG: hypothetical protein UV59_C0008G0027 [Candidatus Gottesmanbacteria bacterium GW2011_GWA1_43_11]
MTSISHALIGAAIAAKIGDPFAAGTVAFATHFLCDMIPHWDLGTNWRNRPRSVTGTLAIVETLIALIGTYLLFSSIVPNQSTLVIAIIASLIPDWLEAPYYILMPNSPKLFYYLYKVQSIAHERLQYPWGVVTQVVTVVGFLWVGFGL